MKQSSFSVATARASPFSYALYCFFFLLSLILAFVFNACRSEAGRGCFSYPLVCAACAGLECNLHDGTPRRRRGSPARSLCGFFLDHWLVVCQQVLLVAPRPLGDIFGTILDFGARAPRLNQLLRISGSSNSSVGVKNILLALPRILAHRRYMRQLIKRRGSSVSALR